MILKINSTRGHTGSLLVVIICNTSAFSQRRPLSSRLGGMTAKSLAAIALIGCCALLGRFRWLPRESRGTAENSVVSPGKLPGDTMVVLVGQMGILSAHAWCGTSVKNTMEETIMKRMIYVNHAIL